VIRGLLAGIASFSLHLIGEYRQFWWWDNLSHFTAGISIGSAACLLPGFTSPKEATVIGLLISVPFELGEFSVGAWPYKDKSVGEDQVAEDVLLDVILVAAGSALAAWLDQDSRSS